MSLRLLTPRRLARHDGLLAGEKTSDNAENTDSQVDEVKVKIWAELYGTEIVQTEEARKGDERINRSEYNSKAARAGRILAKPGSESDYSTQQVEEIVCWRKREIEHFVAEESGNADNN